MDITLLGDLHGDFGFYDQWIKQIDNSCDYSIVLGDFGLGFSDAYDNRYIQKLGSYKDKHMFIRGNHDSPRVCKDQQTYLGDYGIFKDKLFFVSGGWSIDYDYRTPGINWWHDEELSYSQIDELLELYKEAKPEIVISHDCPDMIKNKIVTPIKVNPSKTGLFMDEMIKIHKPKHWYFGHYHISKQVNFLGIDFRCLNINEMFKIKDI